MVLFFVAAIGIAGCFLFGLLGLGTGQAGELERILALVSFATTAASLLGIVLDDGISYRAVPFLARADKLDLWIGMAVALFMLALLVATLLPSIYVMLPVFAARRLLLPSRHPSEPRSGPAHHAPAFA